MFLKKKVIFFSVFVLIACDSTSSVQEIATEEKRVVTELPYYDHPDFTPIWNPENRDTLHRVASFEFINQNNQLVNDSTVQGKIYLVNFFFTTCGSICPKMMRNMERVQNHFEKNSDVLFISHTVTPWLDSVAALKKYEENFDIIENKWHLVTGNKTALYDLARTSYFVEEEPGFTKDSTEFLHTEHFVLVDRNRHLRGLYNGTLELEMDRIIEDIELLLTED